MVTVNDKSLFVFILFFMHGLISCVAFRNSALTGAGADMTHSPTIPSAMQNDHYDCWF